MYGNTLCTSGFVMFFSLFSIPRVYQGRTRCLAISQSSLVNFHYCMQSDFTSLQLRQTLDPLKPNFILNENIRVEKYWIKDRALSTNYREQTRHARGPAHSLISVTIIRLVT